MAEKAFPTSQYTELGANKLVPSVIFIIISFSGSLKFFQLFFKGI